MKIPTRRGQPKTHTKKLSLVFTPEQHEQLQKCAYVLNVPMAEAVRRGLAKLEKSLRNDGTWMKRMKELEEELKEQEQE